MGIIPEGRVSSKAVYKAEKEPDLSESTKTGVGSSVRRKHLQQSSRFHWELKSLEKITRTRKVRKPWRGQNTQNKMSV